VTTLIFEDQIIDPAQREIVDDQPLGSASKFGDLAGQYIPNVLYMFGQYLDGVYGDPQGYDRARGMLKASLYASSVTTILKYTIREPRPINGEEDRESFPSGHSAAAFAFSGYVLGEHGWTWGAPALLISSFSAFSRINDNRHFLHDVLAGATIGLSYGLGISYLQKSQRESENKTSMTFVPIYDHDTKGIALVAEF